MEEKNNNQLGMHFEINIDKYKDLEKVARKIAEIQKEHSCRCTLKVNVPYGVR